jgi:hypothetical protein
MAKKWPKQKLEWIRFGNRNREGVLQRQRKDWKWGQCRERKYDDCESEDTTGVSKAMYEVM